MKIKLVVFIATILILSAYVGKQVVANKINPVAAEQPGVQLTKIFTIEQLNDMDYGFHKFNADLIVR